MPTYVLKQMYYAFFHPYLFYGLFIWGAMFKSYLKPLQFYKTKRLRQ